MGIDSNTVQTQSKQSPTFTSSRARIISRDQYRGLELEGCKLIHSVPRVSLLSYRQISLKFQSCMQNFITYKLHIAIYFIVDVKQKLLYRRRSSTALEAPTLHGGSFLRHCALLGISKTIELQELHQVQYFAPSIRGCIARIMPSLVFYRCCIKLGTFARTELAGETLILSVPRVFLQLHKHLQKFIYAKMNEMFYLVRGSLLLIQLLPLNQNIVENFHFLLQSFRQAAY